MSLYQAKSLGLIQSKRPTESPSDAQTADNLLAPQLSHPADLDYIRVTSLKTFEYCPFTWAFKNLPVGDAVPEERVGAAAIGTAVHTICEDFLMKLYCPDGYESDNNTLQEAWKLVPAEEAGKVGIYLQNLAEMRVSNPLAIEERLYYTMVEGMPPISGQMDFICEINDGQDVLIVDHKTNRGYNDADWWSAQMQQLLYAWMVRREYPGFRDYYFQIGYPNLGIFVRWKTEPEDDGPLEARIAGIWADMLRYAETGAWPRRINSECGWCPIKSTCPEHTEALTSFADSMRKKVGSASEVEKLAFIRDVKKIVDKVLAETEETAADQIRAAGGTIVVDGKKWTLERSERRKADYVETIEACTKYLEVHPEHTLTLSDCMSKALTVSVTSLDDIGKALPPFKAVVEKVARKVPSEKESIKCVDAKRAVAK
jgi:hypothetical protein